MHEPSRKASRASIAAPAAAIRTRWRPPARRRARGLPTLGLVALGAAACAAGAASGRPLPAQGGGLGPQLGAGRLLVASRELRDPNFAGSVVVLLDYDRDGAVGVVVNQPSGESLANALPTLDGAGDRPLYLGGPVQSNRLLVLVRSSRPVEGADQVTADLYAGSTATLLERLLGDPKSVDTFRVYAGYAGWAPSQLDAEVAAGSWHVLPPDADAVFDDDVRGVWPRLMLRTSSQWAELSWPTPPPRAPRRPARLPAR